MSLFRLVYREIWFRKLGFALGVLAVTIAVAALAGSLLLLNLHDRRTEEIVAAKETQTQAVMAKLEDEIRVITKNLGFNIRILPKDVNLLDFFAKDYADKYMPEEYVDRLANSKIVSINHLLPILQRKIDWPEEKIPALLLVGTRGEVPILAQDKKKAFIPAVPKGKIVLGNLLERGHQPGDAVVLHGRKFVIHKIQPRRGDQDDITAWIPLADAQEMFDKKGLINGMLALGCNCNADRLSVIRQEIMEILPETQVEEFETKATARAEARTKVAEEAKAAVAREQEHRAELRGEKEAFAALLVPLTLIAACAWVGLLAWSNVRERRAEIGLLRALGLRSVQLLTLFLSRAVLVGVTGAVPGLLLGVVVAASLGDGATAAEPGHVIGLLWIIVAAPLVAVLASWLAALSALRHDPANILQQETS
ncbi:MAG: FtsX-like permease family protein [Gemmataceae bacterium]|nr:FtsX-like permease family protein [Gemmataceae bacterium]MCI0738054.1 FtsX-like permease family protein [Gemmataceae bacterium]